MGLGSIVGGIVKSPLKLAASVTGLGVGLKVLGGFKDFLMGKKAEQLPPAAPGMPGAPGMPATPGAPADPTNGAFMTPIQQMRMGIDPMAQFQQPAAPVAPPTQK